MKTKAFDCIASKHQAAALILEQIKGMTLEEELAWWQERDRELRERQEALQRAQQKIVERS